MPQAGLPALEFYSEMKSDRDAVIRSLGQHGGIVIAIRCLDEGVDIPVTDHALILASSTVSGSTSSGVGACSVKHRERTR